MLQDMAYGRLENEFAHPAPEKGDLVICCRGNSILVRRDRYDALFLPCREEVPQTARESHLPSPP